MSRLRGGFRLMFALPAVIATGAASANDSVSVPLSGTLPVQCSVQVHRISIDETTPSTSITIVVQHQCNARNNLVVRIRPGEGPANVDFASTYNAQSPSAKAPDRQFFFQAGPTDQVKEVRVAFPNLSRRDAELMLDRLQISVESF